MTKMVNKINEERWRSMNACNYSIIYNNQIRNGFSSVSDTFVVNLCQKNVKDIHFKLETKAFVKKKHWTFKCKFYKFISFSFTSLHLIHFMSS
jgi:hypothetical protein